MLYYENKNGKLYQGDCLEVMDKLIKKGVKVDAIICDLPYGQTKNKWDSVIPFEDLWLRYDKLIKERGVIALFGQGLFTADLMNSNRKNWKYNLIWDKVLTSGFLNANRMPLRSHEDIVIFYKKAPKYYPQKIIGNKNHSKGAPKNYNNNNYGDFDFVDNVEVLGDMKHPKSILQYSKPHPSIARHPTEKSVELYEWIIKSYSSENDLILDNCSGSGTLAEASENTNRKWICIEKEDKYCEISKKRLEEKK